MAESESESNDRDRDSDNDSGEDRAENEKLSYLQSGTERAVWAGRWNVGGCGWRRVRDEAVAVKQRI